MNTVNFCCELKVSDVLKLSLLIVLIGISFVLSIDQPLISIAFYCWLSMPFLLVIKQLGFDFLIRYLWQIAIPMPFVLVALIADFGKVDVNLLIEVCTSGNWFELAPVTFTVMVLGCAASSQLIAKKMLLSHTLLCHLGMLIGMWIFSFFSTYLPITQGILLLLAHLLAMVLAAEITYILVSITTIKEKKIGNFTL